MMKRGLLILLLTLAPKTVIGLGVVQRQPAPTVIQVPTPVPLPPDYEDHWIEFTLGYWPLRATGDLLTEAGDASLEDDLGIRGWKSHPFARLTLQPARKHKIAFEGIPYRLNGAGALNREFVIGGEPFTVNEDIESTVKLTYFYAGYQYDFVSRPRGHTGFILGVGYVDAISKIRSRVRAQEQTTRARVPFPVVGLGFRGFPLDSDVVNFSGELKGFHFGNYGHYLQGSFAVGYSPVEQFTIQLGYSVLDTTVQNKHENEGIRARFRGPTISIQLRNR